MLTYSTVAVTTQYELLGYCVWSKGGRGKGERGLGFGRPGGENGKTQHERCHALPACAMPPCGVPASIG